MEGDVVPQAEMQGGIIHVFPAGGQPGNEFTIVVLLDQRLQHQTGANKAVLIGVREGVQCGGFHRKSDG